MSKDTGGPAFPQPSTIVPTPVVGGGGGSGGAGSYDRSKTNGATVVIGSAGMTLRDYFAAHAPEIKQTNRSNETQNAQDARHRYMWADAMLKERAK